MRLLRQCKQWLSRAHVGYSSLIAFLLCPIFSSAAATDLLQPAQAEISSTFGSGSTLWVIIYTLEILAAGYSFVIKKSLPVFLGVVALIIFTTVAFTLIPS
ncbi:MAG TPA: type IV conjugative transfer system pilin TraA [bacterium]|nr:type IV conjugative transfer system pilin TraA [bacterium]